MSIIAPAAAAAAACASSLCCQIELLSPPCLLGESCLLAGQYHELYYRPATLRCMGLLRLLWLGQQGGEVSGWAVWLLSCLHPSRLGLCCFARFMTSIGLLAPSVPLAQFSPTNKPNTMLAPFLALPAHTYLRLHTICLHAGPSPAASCGSCRCASCRC